ncbi:MAG: exodeoxyribonuclease VII large subunit [Prevotellaceae bacterium]|jgi:exodeoxyribonuclease VII large subunit|nr:exodeoxyribonuclease VII large subunit [Prevotellaceae bacterium]
MSETIKDKTVFTLLEVMRSVQKTLESRYKSSYWIKAEMNRLNFYRQSGHCYPDLVEKRDGKTVAQMRAILWKDDYKRINNLFLKTLNEPLKDGIKLLFLAKISFDSTHGLTLKIIDIDPNYTLGDLEREKQETLRQLKEEGLFERNKSLKLPLLPQRIAVISVETSKGYKDFIGKIEHNDARYCFFHFLFPSLLQGEKVVASICGQLLRIRQVMHHFDLVAIVRGGGGDIGLSSYNNYQLAREIALFPLPVLTGIGHITNETVTEMVAYRNLITPTDLAIFLIQQFHNFAVPLRRAEQKIISQSKQIIARERLALQSEMKLFRSASKSVFFHGRNNILQLHEKLSDKSHQLLNKQQIRMESLTQTVRSLDPREILRRGYSITMYEGKALTDLSKVKEGSELNTLLLEGNITSTIQNINKEEKL